MDHLIQSPQNNEEIITIIILFHFHVKKMKLRTLSNLPRNTYLVNRIQSNARAKILKLCAKLPEFSLIKIKNVRVLDHGDQRPSRTRLKFVSSADIVPPSPTPSALNIGVGEML